MSSDPIREGTFPFERLALTREDRFAPSFQEAWNHLICATIHNLAFYLITITSASLAAIGSGDYDG
jgi:hypothetical protein